MYCGLSISASVNGAYARWLFGPMDRRTLARLADFLAFWRTFPTGAPGIRGSIISHLASCLNNPTLCAHISDQAAEGQGVGFMHNGYLAVV
jgi:hypothetical protein